MALGLKRKSQQLIKTLVKRTAVSREEPMPNSKVMAKPLIELLPKP